MTTEQTRTAHTPGPWHVTGSGEHGEMIYADAGRTVAAWPYGGANPPESIEAMANARLIASAPALLAALENIENAMTLGHERNIEDSIDWPRYIAEARAAIAAARGERDA